MPASVPAKTPLIAPLLDRLTRPSSVGPVGQGVALQAVIESVRRDVEELLNSRKNDDAELDAFPELRTSVFAYGMPEVVSRPALTTADRVAIGSSITETITRFEPRLRNVRTRLESPPTGLERRLAFRIEGVLRVEPSPDVEFETVLELSSGQTSVVAEVK